MPQGPTHLHARWQTSENALQQLGRNFVVSEGWIKPLVPEYRPSLRDLSAIAYLVMEWDYAYSDEDIQIDLDQFADCIEVKFAGEVRKLTLEPSDVLVFKLHFPAGNDIMQAIKEQIEKQVPHLKSKFIILDKNIDIFAIGGPDVITIQTPSTNIAP